MIRQSRALFIPGFVNPDGSDKPVLLADRDIPVGISGLPTNYTVFSCMPAEPSAVSGITYSTRPFNPVHDYGSLKVILNDQDRHLSKQLSNDVYEYDTRLIQIDNVSLTSALATIRVIAVIAPTVNDFFYIEDEAVQVTSVTALGTNVYSLGLKRGVLGSINRSHQTQPIHYRSGINGIGHRMVALPFMDLDSKIFDASLFVLNGDTVYSEIKGFIDGSPSYNPSRGQWEFTLAYIGRRIKDHVFGVKSYSVPVRDSIKILASEEGSDSVVSSSGITRPSYKPKEIEMSLSRIEAEKAFNFLLRDDSDATELSSTRVTDLSDVLNYSDKIKRGFKIESSDVKMSAFVRSIALSSLTVAGITRQRLTVRCTVEAFEGLIKQDEVLDSVDSHFSALAGLLSGNTQHFPVVTGTTIEPFIEIVDEGPVGCLLHLLLSRNGEGEVNSTYDTIGSMWGLGLRSTDLDLGTVPSDITTVAEDTKLLLELNALIDREYRLRVKTGDKLEDIINNIAKVCTSITGIDPSSGKWGMCRYYRLTQGTVITLEQDVRYAPTLARLEKARRLQLLSGIDPISSEPRYENVVELLTSAHNESVDVSVRLWNKGNSVDLLGSNSQQASYIVQAFFKMLRNGALVLETALPDEFCVANDVRYGKRVKYSDDRIFDRNGNPLVDKLFIVLDTDRDLNGLVNVRLLADHKNVLSSSEGLVAPMLRVTAVNSIVTLTADLTVESLGEASVNLNTAHQAIWNDIRLASGYVRAFNVTLHNPVASDERRGYLEGYASLDSFPATNRMSITFDSSWERGGYTLSNLLVAGDTYISLPDFRLPSSNPEGVTITPLAEQLAGQDDFILIKSSGLLSFSNHTSIIGA